MKAIQGVKMSYRLHELLQRGNSADALRGARVDDIPTSLNSYLYSLIRGNRSQRRGLLTSLLNMFDDTAVSLCLCVLYVSFSLPLMSQEDTLSTSLSVIDLYNT